MLTPKKIHGYDGPTGPYVALRGQTLPLTDPAAIIALTDSALLTGLGYSDKAAQYTTDIAAGHGAISAAD